MGRYDFICVRFDRLSFWTFYCCSDGWDGMSWASRDGIATMKSCGLKAAALNI